MAAATPWRQAFRLDYSFPRNVLGPRLLLPFARLALIFLSEVIGVLPTDVVLSKYSFSYCSSAAPLLGGDADTAGGPELMAPPLLVIDAGEASSATLDAVVGSVDAALIAVLQAGSVGSTASSRAGAGTSANSTSTISSAS
jgi:hypothetical protein